MLHKAEEWKLIARAPKIKYMKQHGGDVRLDADAEEKLVQASLHCEWRGRCTTLLNMVDILQGRAFSFVLTHQRIDGYVHYSDLNHQIVKWTFYVMLEAVERLALENLRPGDERAYLKEKLSPEENDDWPVYAGESFDIWTPDTGKYYAFTNAETIQEAAHQKWRRASHSSPYSALPKAWREEPQHHPILFPRINFCGISRK